LIIYFDLTTKEILRTEDNTMVPILPMNSTFEEQKSYYESINQNFISLPYEMGIYIYNFKLAFDVNGSFTGLQPK